MADQRPKLPIPTAEDIKKFKAVPQGSGKTPLASTSLPIPTAEDIKKFKAIEPVEKKKPMASPSVLEKPAVSSVTGLRPLVPSSESISPRENEVIEKKPTSMLGGATQPSVSVTGSQGKLLIPERKEKFPAITETVTTFKKVPVTAPSKETKNLPLNPELMLQAIAGNERGKLGELTSVKSKSGVPNTARGTYQITEGTLETIFNKDANFKKSYNNFEQFKKDFNTNPDVEHQAALSHMMDLVETHGINALLAWFSPTHAARAAAGDKKALREIPGRSAGNTTTAGNYYDSALSKYRSLLGKQPDQQKMVNVPIKKEVIQEPAVEVPSLQKFNVLSPTWYNPDVDTKIDVKETVKNLTLKNKQLVSSYKDYKKEKEALNAEIEQLNLLSSNPANMPLVAAKQREIEARSLQLDNTFDQLSSEAERAKDDEASLNVAMVKSATDKAKQGSWGGAIWNSFVEGYKSIGKAATRNTSNALIELFDAIGVPYAADKKMTKDEAKKNIINEFIPIIEKGYDVIKSKGTTQEFIAEKQKEGYIPKALLGLAQSAPTMLSGNYGAFVNGALQTYDGVVKGMDDDPFAATMTENEKNTVAMPIALIGGVLEQIGFRTVLGKSKPALFQFSKYVISKLPANAGIQAITNAVESAAKSKIGKGILAGTGAYLGEAETGGAQYVTEVGIKELYDQIQGVDLFKNPSMLSKEFAYKALEDAHVEGLGGLMMKGMAGGIQMTVGGVKGKMDDASYKLWSDMMNNEDQVSIYKAQIQSDLANNKITREEAQLKMDETDRARGIISQIPTDLSTRNQREAFGLIAEKQSLTTAIAGKEPSLVSKQSDRIKQIDEQLKQISNAVQEQTTSEVPVQPEAGARLQMAEGEPQAEPQIPAKEGQEVVDITANIPKQDLPQVMGLVSKIEKGEEVSSPQDLQTQQNYAKEVESLLAIRATDKIQEPTIANIDVTTPTQFKEGEMPEIPIDQIDWEASGMGTENDAIDSFGGIIDINVVDVQEKNEQGQYVGRVRVLGQDTSKEGVVVFNDPNAPKKPKAPRKKNVSPEFELAEKILSDSGVYPLFNKVNKIAEIVKKKKGNITQEDIQGVIKVYNKKAKLIADSFNKQKKNENIQPKKPRAEVNAEEITQGAQPKTRATEQPAQPSSKRREIKDSLEKLKDAGLLRSAITTRKNISQGEIDTQMALTDAMANVWKETTGRDDFYENFYNDVTQGDIDAIMEKGGILFQNLELPQRPLTRVSLGVFDLPEFKKMEGQEVSINSVRDLARTRGKQIEKDLMQSTLEFDKYKDAKKISFDEFKSDVEMQVMKLEKIVTSSYASYGADNLGDSDLYGDANTIIYNSPVDHGEYGHFRGDFTPTSIMSGTMTEGFNMSWNDWDVRQIPGTDQYAAVDKSMPENVSQYELANYIGTAGTKEQVEKWIDARKNHEGNINVGLFGHTRVWYDKGNPYYLAELQSDYFQKNDPNDLYTNQISSVDSSDYAYKKFDENDKKRLRERLESDLGVGEVLKIKQDKSEFRLFLDVKGKFIEVLNWPYTEGEANTKDEIATQKDNARYRLLKKFHEIVNGISPFPEEFSSIWASIPSSETSGRKEFKWNIFDEYNVNRNNLLHSYRQEYIKDEVEKIKNSEKGASMLKQFAASQKVHELRLLRESFRNAAQEGAETLRFPTPFTLAVIEGYVNKPGENGAPYEIIIGNSDRLFQGDIIDYGGIEMVVVDQNGRDITVAPRDEVHVYDYYDLINSETENYTDETISEIKRSVNDVNNITESDLDSIEFGDLSWAAGGTSGILRNAIEQSEDGSISLSDVEDRISDGIKDNLYNSEISEVFWGDEIFSDGDQTYYLVERRGSIETLSQPDEYDDTADPDLYETNLGSAQKTVVNKYKELNKIFKKMRPDAEVITDDNGMQWLETKLTPEDANNPLIAFQEEGGNIKGAVDFSNDNKASIYIFDGADVSTLAHEAIGHVGRRFLEQLANVDEDFASDYEKAKEWAGVKDNQWTIAAEEKWARGFEKYLRDGKAPIKALKSVFKNLSDWLKNIYKRIKGSSIDIELTPSVIKVFDNLLGARSEVEFKNLAGYDRMMGEVEGIVDKSFKRGVPYMQTMDNAIQYMSTSRVYEDANDTQREAMVREVRKMFKQKEKNAPSVNKILDISIERQLVNVVAAAKDYRKMRIKDVKLALAAYRERIKEFLDGIKALGKSGKLTSAQVKALLNTFSGDLLNQTVFDRAMARAKRIIENSQYAEKVSNANGLRLKIRKALSADNNKKRKDKLQAAVANMASNLAKVAPKMVDDIDLYLERANEVLAAIRNPKITDVEVIGRMAADINAVNEYAKDELGKQEQARKDEMLDQYDYLVEAGVLNESMSLRDINKLVAEIMDGKPVESDKLNEAGLVFFRSLFNDYSQIINKMLSGTDPITGEDTDISQGDKELVRRFLAIDPDKVTDLTDMFNIANAAQEFITNDIIDNMEVMIKNNLGLQNVKMDAENPKMRGYKAVLPWVANFAKLPIFSKIINIKLAPVQEYIRNIFRGETNAVTFEKNSGFTGIYNGSTKAMTDSDIADTEYVDKFYNKKPNGKKFFDVSNVFERGIFADLYRTTFGTEAEVQEEFERKVGQLELTIKEKEKSDKKIDQEEASELQKSYDKIVKGSKNINDVMSKMAKDNIDGVMWWIDKWDSKFPEIDRVAKSTYNDVLERQANYTPEGWVKIADQVTLDDDMLSRSFNKMNMSYVDTRRAGTLMKYSASKGLPVNDKTKEVTHVKSYHFDINNSESFKKTLKDVYTAPSIVQYMAYTNSPEFSTIIPDKKTRDNLKEKIAFAINALKDTEIDISAESYRDYNKAMKKFTDIARAQALVSVKTPIMQTVPVVVGTAIDLVNDPASFAKGMVTTFNMDFHKALNKAGYGISVRGLEAIAALDAAEKRIRESKGLDLNVFNNIAKISNLQLKYLLSKPDIVAARQAWVSYYLHKLKSMGISTANIDWNTHEFNDEAANYAERKTNSKLNQNIQEMAGQAFASRSQKMRFIRNTVLNFASFAYNMKYRFWTDLTILGSKNSNSIDKADAAKDIVRTTGEGALYVYIGAIVGHYLKGLMFDLVGYDEPEEDKKSAEEYLNTNMLTKGILDLLSPMPGIGDLLFVKGINNLADLAFGEQEKEMPNKEKLFYVKARPEVEKQFRLYEPPEKTESETYLSLLGGMSGIFGKNVNELYKSGKLINEGEQFQMPNSKNPNKPLIDTPIEYTDKFNNKIEFSNKEKEMMKLPFLLQTLGTIGLGVRDQAETANKVRRSLEKRAKKRMAASKKEKLFYVPKAE